MDAITPTTAQCVENLRVAFLAEQAVQDEAERLFVLHSDACQVSTETVSRRRKAEEDLLRCFKAEAGA